MPAQMNKHFIKSNKIIDYAIIQLGSGIKDDCLIS